MGWRSVAAQVKRYRQGGIIKAMALIDPYNSADPVQECFNGQLPGPQVDQRQLWHLLSEMLLPPVLYPRDVYFGFDVSNRFVRSPHMKTRKEILA